ncbi:MAG: hypothetical protein ABIE68_00415 [bacterium]
MKKIFNKTKIILINKPMLARIMVYVVFLVIFVFPLTAHGQWTPWFSNSNVALWIKQAYQWGVGIVIAIAMAAIVQAGVLWTTAAGNPEAIQKAKQIIGAAVSGVVIALISYTLLNILDDRLVELKPASLDLPPSDPPTNP